MHATKIPSAAISVCLTRYYARNLAKQVAHQHQIQVRSGCHCSPIWINYCGVAWLSPVNTELKRNYQGGLLCFDHQYVCQYSFLSIPVLSKALINTWCPNCKLMYETWWCLNCALTVPSYWWATISARYTCLVSPVLLSSFLHFSLCVLWTNKWMDGWMEKLQSWSWLDPRPRWWKFAWFCII